MNFKNSSVIVSYHKIKINVWILACLLSFQQQAFSQKKKPEPFKPLIFDKGGKLKYVADAQGNRIPDFSYAGYQAGNAEIPNVDIKITVAPKAGDATVRIQQAIDYVAKQPLDKNGFRGAVLLQEGNFEVWSQLKMRVSGVVLRGSGTQKTTITGAGLDRETLIRVYGVDDAKTSVKTAITDAYVPVNALSFTLAKADAYKVGDRVRITRPSTAAWLDTMKTWTFGGDVSSLGWKPGEEDVVWDRQITAINGNKITVDAPITVALDQQFGGAYIQKYEWKGRIENIGIENLSLVSTYDKSNPKDENHRWMAITLENCENAWVRQVTFKHFAGSAVNILATGRCITVEDCKSLAPVSEIGGQRRYTFLTSGQQTLFQRLYSEYGYHDFAVGYLAAGPNAFVQCKAYLPFSYSGAIDTWASGALFDVMNIDGNALSYANIGQDARGAGWTAANSVFWQCSASRVYNFKPPTAQNWAFGTWSEFQGDGFWDFSNEHINPRSLYYAQLAERLNKNVDARAQIFNKFSEATSSPTVEQARQMTLAAAQPLPLLEDFIDSASLRNPIPTNGNKMTSLDAIKMAPTLAKAKKADLLVQNGWLTRNGLVLTGGRQSVPWWTGGIHGTDIIKAKPAITRYVPGRVGKGLTDDLEEMTDNMLKEGKLITEQNYGLWYDRRRDDHERIRRMSGEVWPPFYELPFARSGEGTAWDGLSKYDLTKYNPWYWDRLKQYANLADEKGLVLIHQNYFQHNIIEAGAHYADFPWRTANNINNTGFAEPVPYAGDKRIFLADQFYDETNPQRRPLHQAYIEQCLNNFVGNSSVIQFIGEEFTGPTHFTKFWVQTIKDWESKTGNKALIGLSTTKDVQDAILEDPSLAPTIDIIDIRYWHYQADGSAYAPLGGQSLAPRQQARQFKPKKTSFEQVYKAVREYRDKYPDKAVMFSGDNYPSFTWAAFIAGGSFTGIKAEPAFLHAAATMRPTTIKQSPYALANDKGEYIIYADADADFGALNLAKSAIATWISPSSGKTIVTQKINQIKKPANGAAVLWIHKK
ncbi:DUF6298 domain-containing protein [Pelobium manganitolerans]|uniref:DUF6298 domain-containing protein n=1 Tax=Pelobium manganitolerans TaxID=1842495 RepID=UPI003FA3A2B1